MWYFHIHHLLHEKDKFMSKTEYEEYFKETGTIKDRYIRYIKSNIGRRGAMRHLNQLLDTFEFTSVMEFSQNSVITEFVKI